MNQYYTSIILLVVSSIMLGIVVLIELGVFVPIFRSGTKYVLNAARPMSGLTNNITVHISVNQSENFEVAHLVKALGVARMTGDEVRIVIDRTPMLPSTQVFRVSRDEFICDLQDIRARICN